MCLNLVTRLQEKIYTGYQSIKRHSEFEKILYYRSRSPFLFLGYSDIHFLGYSLEVTMTNDTCLKSSMALQAYKVVRTHAHETSGWTILSRLLDSRSPNIGWMNGDVESDISTLEFNNRKQLEHFHSIILILKK